MAGPWLACTGSPVLLTVVLYTPVPSLIGQSLRLWMRSSELGEPQRGVVGQAAAVHDGNKPPRQRCTTRTDRGGGLCGVRLGRPRMR